jgi:hypothetical protein
MKTKHTNVGLSLLVIVTALIFGLGGASAKGELIQLKKSLKEKVYYTGRGPGSVNRNPPIETIGTIEVGEGEEITKIKLLTIAPKKDWHGVIDFKVKYPQFKDPSILTYEPRNARPSWELTSNQDAVVGEAWPIYGPATIEILFKPATKTTHLGNNNYEVLIVDQIIQVLIKKERSAFAQSPTQLQALVLPKNTKNTRLIVESSEDLVNWAIDTPGPKTTTNRERFFRLRAVKE